MGNVKDECGALIERRFYFDAAIEPFHSGFADGKANARTRDGRIIVQALENAEHTIMLFRRTRF